MLQHYNHSLMCLARIKLRSLRNNLSTYPNKRIVEGIGKTYRTLLRQGYSIVSSSVWKFVSKDSLQNKEIRQINKVNKK